MTIRAGLGYSIFSQRRVCPKVIISNARIRASESRRGSAQHGTTTQSVIQLIAVSSGFIGVNFMSESPSEDEGVTLSGSQENLKAFEVLFSRHRRVLSFVAYHVLGDRNDAQDALENCLLTASSQAPSFEDEGAFRSWLVRVLIDQALLIRNTKS